MEQIDENIIINEANEIIDCDLIEKIFKSEVKKCVCKIKQEIEIEDRKTLRTGTGFFCNIPSKDIKVLITNNHILDLEFLNKEEKLIIFIEKEKKELNLEIARLKIADKEFDFTIIEILEEDNISNFLEIDEYINTDDYTNQQIFSFQYPGGLKLKYSHGKINKRLDKYFVYSLGTDGGSSGSPIILVDSLKLIGLHKGKYDFEKNNEIGLGIPMNLIINKINYIKCIFNVKEKNIDNEIQILNNGFNDLKGFTKKNEEIEKNIKIILDKEIRDCFFKYKFKKEGKYKIYYIQEKELTNMSYMFNGCQDMEEINLLSFNTIKAENMSYMFNGCSLLKNIGLSSFNTKNVVDMNHMFAGCSFLNKLDLSSFNTNKVTNMSWMFSACSKAIEIKLESFNTDNVIDMGGMLSGCSSLKEINLSTFNTINVVDMQCMFGGCSSLKEINLSSFNTINLTNIGCMFCGCSSLKYINLSSFNIDKLTDIGSLFYGCSSLKEHNISSFNTNNKIVICNMFKGISSSANLICDDPKIIEKFKESQSKCNIF